MAELLTSKTWGVWELTDFHMITCKTTCLCLRLFIIKTVSFLFEYEKPAWIKFVETLIVLELHKAPSWDLEFYFPFHFRRGTLIFWQRGELKIIHIKESKDLRRFPIFNHLVVFLRSLKGFVDLSYFFIIMNKLKIFQF